MTRTRRSSEPTWLKRTRWTTRRSCGGRSSPWARWSARASSSWGRSPSSPPWSSVTRSTPPGEDDRAGTPAWCRPRNVHGGTPGSKPAPPGVLPKYEKPARAERTEDHDESPRPHDPAAVQRRARPCGRGCARAQPRLRPNLPSAPGAAAAGPPAPRRRARRRRSPRRVRPAPPAPPAPSAPTASPSGRHAGPHPVRAGRRVRAARPGTTRSPSRSRTPTCRSSSASSAS